MPLAVLVGVVLLIIFVIAPNYPRRLAPTAAPQVFATLDPTIVANVTALPRMQPLTSIESTQLEALQVQVDACADYSEARRSQVSQHIRWLLEPSTIPVDVLIAAGQNPLAGLVNGMAFFTSTEWRLRDRPADSCLVNVGRTLNQMLVAVGEAPITLYDE